MTGLRILVAASSMLILSACAHSTMRGSVAMKTNDREAHVCLGKNEVKIGDKVALFQSVCPTGRSAKGGNVGTCEKRRTGQGVVTQILNEHYSVVEFEPGAQFDEGSFVEKL